MDSSTSPPVPPGSSDPPEPPPGAPTGPPRRPPPPYWPPPSPPPKGRSASFWVALLLLMLLAGSFFLNVILAASLGASGLHESEDGTMPETRVLGKRDAQDKVLDIQISGLIMEEESSGAFSARRDPVSSVIAQLRQARKDPHIKAILLEVDSPGGGITASDIIYHHLATFRKEKNIPIVVLFGDIACSGGYYVSMAGDFIMAHETTMTGSIGVIAQFFDVHSMMGKIGVNVNTIKSQRANGTESFKDIGSPFRPMKPAERQLLQGMVTEMWGRFVTVVATGRAGKLTKEQIQSLADGRIFTGRQALDLKLVDGLGYREDAWKKAAEMGKAPDAKLVQYRVRPNLLKEILSGRTQQTPLESVVNRYLERMNGSGPRLLYLWSL